MNCHRGSNCKKHLPPLGLGNEERTLELLKLRNSEEEANLKKESQSAYKVSLRRQDAFEQAPGVGDGQGSLVCCSPWGHRESDMTEQLYWTELTKKKCSFQNSRSSIILQRIERWVWMWEIKTISEKTFQQLIQTALKLSKVKIQDRLTSCHWRLPGSYLEFPWCRI